MSVIVVDPAPTAVTVQPCAIEVRGSSGGAAPLCGIAKLIEARPCLERLHLVRFADLKGHRLGIRTGFGAAVAPVASTHPTS